MSPLAPPSCCLLAIYAMLVACPIGGSTVMRGWLAAGTWQRCHGYRWYVDRGVGEFFCWHCSGGLGSFSIVLPSQMKFEACFRLVCDNGALTC